MKRIYSGFTLINLLVTLTLISLLASAGTASLSALIGHQQSFSRYERLFTLIQFTRSQAVSYRSQVILCPSINEQDCINDWSQTLMIFVDRNDDETRNSNEKLLQIQAPLSTAEELHWRASGSRRYIRYKADGSTGNQNGRLSYCLRKGEHWYAKQIIVYRTGRARRGDDADAESLCSES